MAESKPLTATLEERSAPFLSLLSDKQRVAPPSSRPVKSTPPPPLPRRVHALKPPEGPDRTLVAPPEPRKVPDVAAKKKKKKKRPAFDAAFKAKAVARALAARESGEESVRDVGHDLGVTDASIYQWIKAAKAANGAASPAAKGRKSSGAGGDIQSVSRELASAMEHVAKLKKKLRKMLGED
jgi:transposase-like protein